MVLSDTVLPMVVMSTTDSAPPIGRRPMIESDADTRTYCRIDIVAPQHAKSSTASDEPMRDMCKTDKVLPKRAKFRRDNALPHVEKSTTDSDAPSRDTPNSEIVDASRTKPLSESELPRFAKSNTERDAPTLLLPHTDSVEPRRQFPLTERSWLMYHTPPHCSRPKIEIWEPIRMTLRSDMVEERCAEPIAEAAGLEREWLRGGIDAPKCACPKASEADAR
jgi:hypothetical protein